MISVVIGGRGDGGEVESTEWDVSILLKFVCFVWCMVAADNVCVFFVIDCLLPTQSCVVVPACCHKLCRCRCYCSSSSSPGLVCFLRCTDVLCFIARWELYSIC